MDFLSQRGARASLRRHAVAVFALGIAAEEASREAILRLPAQRRHRHMRKMYGYDTSSLWSEAIREWCKTMPDKVVRLYEPYEWSELVIAETTHVVLERDEHAPRSSRKAAMRHQVSDLTLPGLPASPSIRPTVVRFVMILSEATGRPSHLCVKVRSGKVDLWAPIEVPRAEATRLLTSWRRRQVAFLDDIVAWAATTPAAPTTKPVAPTLPIVVEEQTVKPTIRPGRRAAGRLTAEEQ